MRINYVFEQMTNFCNVLQKRMPVVIMEITLRLLLFLVRKRDSNVGHRSVKKGVATKLTLTWALGTYLYEYE